MLLWQIKHCLWFQVCYESTTDEEGGEEEQDADNTTQSKKNISGMVDLEDLGSVMQKAKVWNNREKVDLTIVNTGKLILKITGFFSVLASK